VKQAVAALTQMQRGILEQRSANSALERQLADQHRGLSQDAAR
jgi:hypothetical protein